MATRKVTGDDVIEWIVYAVVDYNKTGLDDIVIDAYQVNKNKLLPYLLIFDDTIPIKFKFEPVASKGYKINFKIYPNVMFTYFLFWCDGSKLFLKDEKDNKLGFFLYNYR